MPSRLDYFTAVLATGWAIGMTGLLYGIWLFAYIQGGTATVNIDYFNEAEVEFVIWLLVWAVLIKGGHTVFKVLRHERTDSDEF